MRLDYPAAHQYSRATNILEHKLSYGVHICVPLGVVEAHAGFRCYGKGLEGNRPIKKKAR